MTYVPTPTNTAGVVVTYNPDEGIVGRVGSLAKLVDRVLVVDNGSEPGSLATVRSLETHQGIELLLNGCNLGVAAAFNSGAEWARQQGYDWILLSDHDTQFDDAALHALRAAWGAYPEHEKIAVIGCNFVDSNLGALQYPLTSDEPIWSERETVITSGSLVSLSIFQIIGPLREEFFIDQVDHEYCLRARRRGFRVLSTGQPVMRHTVGVGRIHGWLGFISLNHPPQRWYYLLRNEVSLIREYFLREPHWAAVTAISRIQKTIAMLLFEDRRFAKLRYAMTGFADGVLGRFRHPRA